jgi:hypothetical protein
MKFHGLAPSYTEMNRLLYSEEETYKIIGACMVVRIKV